MRRAPSVLLALVLAALLAACGDPPDAPPSPLPAAAPVVAEPPRPRQRAQPPAAPTVRRVPPTIDGDLGGWRPTDDDLEFAARLAGGPEVEEALDALPPERRIDVLRAGIRLADPLAARRAAILVEHEWLDVWELDRVAKLQIEAILDPEFTEIDGDTPTVCELYTFGTPEDLTRLLAGVAARPVEGVRLSGLLDQHKLGNGSHVAALAALPPSESWDAEDAVATAYVLFNDADVPDDVAFPFLLGRGDPAYSERFPPGTSPVALAVEILLRDDAPKIGSIVLPHRAWAWRRLGRATLTPADLDPLLRLAEAPAREDEPDLAPLLLLRLGTPEALRAIRESRRGKDGDVTFGWLAARAAVGVEAARADLRRAIAAGGEDDALRYGLAAMPAECAAQVEEIVLALKDAPSVKDGERRRLPWNPEAFEPGVPGHVLSHDPALFAGLAARAVERERPAWLLAALAGTIPACRTRAVVEAALARAERPDDLVPTGNDCWLIEELAPYEVVARPALVAWLRRWLRDEDPFVRDLGLSALVRLGDPESAAELVAWDTNVGRSDAEIVALARSDGPVARTLAEARVRDPGSAGWSEDRLWMTCLAVMHGMPEEVELIGESEVSDEAREAMRAHVLAGRWKEALVARLEAEPTERCENVGSVRDDRVVAWLRRVRERRVSELTGWATAELARAGDEAARREHEAAIRSRRYRWCEELTWRQRCFDRPLEWTPFWIEALASNCCETCFAEASFLEDVFDWRPCKDSFLWTYADWARAWWARSGGADAFAYSRVAGRWVRRP